MEKDIKKIFVGCQTSTAKHPELIKKLINIYLKNDFKKFLDCFVHLMKFSLIHGEKIPAIERTLEFIGKFATSVKSEEKEKNDEKISNDDENDVDDIDPFLVAIFEFLLENHDANSKAVRYRVCQLINKILNCMGEQASIDDHLYNTIYDTMLQRLMDKCHSVRVQAILALSRLQDPRNKECPVIKAYLFHLSMDPNPEVRKAVLSNIAITFQTLPDILERRKDKSDVVRRQAYVILAQKVHIRSFTIAQRIDIISEGLKDRNPFVRQALKKNILQAWLRLVNGNILELLKCLDVEASKESAELSLKSLFEDVPYDVLLDKFDLLDERNLIPHDQLTGETVLYWICLAKHLSEEKADDYLEKILPDLTAFCDYVREYIQKESPEEEDPQETAVLMMQKDFVCQQLVSMTAYFDLADEVGRRNLCTLIQLLFITPSVNETSIKALSEVFSRLYPSDTRVNKLVEIISDIREPPEVEKSTLQRTEVSELIATPKEVKKISEDDQRKMKLKLAQVSVKMNQIREELEECVRSLNLEKAMLLKEKMKELEDDKTKLLEQGVVMTPQVTPVVPSSQTRMPEDDDDEIKLLNDPETLSRCLLILCEFLTNPDVTVFGSILRSLHDNLVLPCLKSEYEGVRRLAVRGLSLCCLISKELAKQYLLLLIQISKMDIEEIQFEALQGVFDIWLLYGLHEFNSAAEDVNELEGLVDTEKSADERDEAESLEEGQSSVAGNMIPLLMKMLDTDSSDSRTQVAMGLSKLLLASQINSMKLLSHLITMWYNPDNEEDNMLRHMLGVFFPLYASMGGSNQEALSKTLIPTLHTIFKAPVRSPLSEIDLDDLISFVVSVSHPSMSSNPKKEVVNAHDSLVFAICADILAYPEREYTRALVRSLNQLSLTETDYTRLKQVSCLAQKITEKIKDKVAHRNAQKFRQTVKDLLSSAPKEENQDETLNTTAVDSMQEVALGDVTAELAGSSQQLRRKRILYTTISDLELISDLDSENDRSPLKIKKLDRQASVCSSAGASDDDGVTNVADTDDEEEETAKEVTVDEFELTTNEPPEDMPVRSSSDLFASLDEGEDITLQGEAITKTLISESEEDMENSSSLNSSCSSVHKSPPRKSPRIQGVAIRRTGRKKKQAVSNIDTSPVPQRDSSESSSSPSFYSARNVSIVEGTRQENSEEDDTSIEDPAEHLNGSLRVKLDKFNTPMLKRYGVRKTPRRSAESSSSITTSSGNSARTTSSRNARVSKSSAGSTEDDNHHRLRTRLSDLTIKKEIPSTPSSSSSTASSSIGRTSKVKAERVEKAISPPRKTRQRSSTFSVTETPSSSADSIHTLTRSRQKAIIENTTRSTRSRSSSQRNSTSTAGSVGSSPALVASKRISGVKGTPALKKK